MSEKENTKVFKLELKEDNIKLTYKNTSLLQVIGFMIDGICLANQDTLDITELGNFVKNEIIKRESKKQDDES